MLSNIVIVIPHHRRGLLSPPFLLAFLFPIFGPFFRGFAVAGADFAFEQLTAGIERAGLPQAGQHPHSLPDALLSELTHQSPHLVKMIEELLDLMRLGATAGGDPAAAADVDDIRIPPLL